MTVTLKNILISLLLVLLAVYLVLGIILFGAEVLRMMDWRDNGGD